MALLPRRAPLERKTPLRRSGPALPRSPQGMSRGKLRFRSEKTARLYAEERVPLVQRLLEERPVCEAHLEGCAGRSTEIHEVKTRGRGGSILDPDNCRALCHPCHSWVTDHPAEAHELGLVAHSWE